MAPPRNRRPGYSRRAQYTNFLGYVITVAGAMVALVLLLVSKLDPAAFSALRSGAAEITAPISRGAGAVTSTIGGIPDWIGSFFGVRGENARLKEQIAHDRQYLLQAKAIAYENLRLKKLLNMREPQVVDIANARLVSSSGSSTRRYALLYAGLLQGVHAGMPVRTADGIIGRVVEAGPDTARVLMLIDPESVVPVRRLSDGAPGFATGRGDGMLDVKPITLASGFYSPGDVLVTSGAGGIYPPNLPVAKVMTRNRDGSVARPFARPDALDFAAVMKAYMPPPPGPAPDTRP